MLSLLYPPAINILLLDNTDAVCQYRALFMLPVCNEPKQEMIGSCPIECHVRVLIPDGQNDPLKTM